MKWIFLALVCIGTSILWWGWHDVYGWEKGLYAHSHGVVWNDELFLFQHEISSSSDFLPLLQSRLRPKQVQSFFEGEIGHWYQYQDIKRVRLSSGVSALLFPEMRLWVVREFDSDDLEVFHRTPIDIKADVLIWMADSQIPFLNPKILIWYPKTISSSIRSWAAEFSVSIIQPKKEGLVFLEPKNNQLHLHTQSSKKDKK